LYLKALEIQGFKSFPDKTRLTFEKDITAIVGPNGSGKSNISDAILWVMGEQKTKTLRGSKMEDVIFGGTSLRNPMGFAEVTLIIDNSSRIIDSDFDEIALTRRYFRSGESEYFINREAVRLKDINSLLMDTGLGRDGYSIIGQGRIADIVSTKSTDRREVFDEAVGISRYRYRKEEAERRLERTDENLLRINDKIEELELQVGPLKRQAEVARKYLAFRDSLRVLEISVWMNNLDKIHERASSVNQEYEQAKLELAKVKSERDALYVSSESLTERMHRKEEEIESIREALYAKESEAGEIESAIAVLKNNIENAGETKKRLAQDISEQEGHTETIRGNIAKNEERVSEINDLLDDVRQKLTENDNISAGGKIKLENREKAVNELNSRLTALSIDIRSMESRINMLEEMEKEFEGYSKAVKTVMKESSRGNIRGVHGPVSKLISAENRYALAIETSLGSAGQDIIIDSRNDGRAAIEMLKRTDGGRATFLPIDTIKGNILKDAPVNDSGYIGLAFDLVSYDEKYKDIISNLLGRTVVVESLPDAIRISKNSGDRYRIVTLDGQMINVGGSMTGGSAAKGTGILSRANELQRLKEKLQELKKDESKCRDDIETAKSRLSAARYEFEVAAEDRNTLRSEENSLKTELQAINDSVKQLNELLIGIIGTGEQRRKALESAEESIEGFKKQIAGKEIELSAVKEEIEKKRGSISEISADKLELEKRQSKAGKDAQERSDRLIDLERTVGRIEQRRYASEAEEKNIIEKLWDNYELSHSAAQAIRQPVDNMQQANKKIAEIRREMSALGTPNLGAIEEYDRVSERYEFLTTQRDDVEKAKSELLEIIREITKEMKYIFAERFKQIDEAFRQTFTELFGGGKAALVLEDEDNILESGIEIKVQPPGKALSVLSLLSGGEMAFVAIALYFAILKIRPTPFCVMDEIEAALDEVNVTRYADYMRRMSDKTQFIVITHRRGTMEEADLLYGVTMQEKGVSTVIELDLEEARKTAEN
jgi:Chromosome segregation ATPases